MLIIILCFVLHQWKAVYQTQISLKKRTKSELTSSYFQEASLEASWTMNQLLNIIIIIILPDSPY